MYYIILSVLFITGIYYFKYKASLKGYHKDDFLLVAIGIVFLLYYLEDYLTAVEGITLGRYVRSLSYMINNLLIPLCYIYVCKHCNVGIKSATTVGVFGLILFDIITNANIYLGWTPVTVLNTEPGIHFYFNGKNTFTMETAEIVEVLQSIWIGIRTIILYKKSKKEKLQTTKKGKQAFIGIAITINVLLVDCFIPDSIRLMPIILVVHFITHFTLASILIYMTLNSYLDEIILDENQEVAYIEVEPKFADLKDKLDRLMSEKKLYLNNSISLEDVVKQLNTNRTYLSQMIREYYNTTFTGYINSLRVEEAKRLIKSYKANKMEDIALQCGFNTASTFTRTFKAITGITPHMWR